MARRVNTKFVVILGGSLLAAVGVVVVSSKLLIKKHPEQYIAAAEDAQTRHDWPTALTNWDKAIQISGQNPLVWNGRGIALHAMATEDPEIERRQDDRKSWEQALEIDPNYAPAVKSLVGYWRQEMRETPSVEAFRQARDRSQQFLNLAPQDPDAPDIQGFLYTTILQGWLNGLETDEVVVDQTIAKMRALTAQQPGNADLPFYLAVAAAHRAQLLSRSESEVQQSSAATALYKQAVDIMVASLKGQDTNALMHFHAAQVYAALAQDDHSSDDNQQRYQALSNKEMDLAVAMAKPSDPRFVDIYLSAANQAYEANSDARGEKILGTLLNQSSDPVTVVRAMPLLRQSSSLRPQALQILQTAMDAGGQVSTVNFRRFALLEAMVNLRISDLADMTSKNVVANPDLLEPGESAVPTTPEAQNLKKEIDKEIQLMSDSNIDPVRVVRVQALKDYEEHDYVSAIQVLTQGMTNPAVANDPEMNWELAQAYTQVNERAMATEACEKVVARNPSFLQARKLLIRLLANEPSEDARRTIAQQLEYLERKAPHDPDVLRLEIVDLDPVKDADRMKELYDKLSEATIGDLHYKTVIALRQLKDNAEAQRLLYKAMDVDPGDIATVKTLSQMLARMGHTSDALVVVQRGIIARPDDMSLQLELKQLQQATPSEIRDFEKQLAEKDPDVLRREIDLATEAILTGDYDSARKHLQAAEAINPSDKDVWDRFFRLYTATKEWDKLEPYIEKLGDINYDQAHGLLYRFQAARAKGDAKGQMDLAKQLTSQLPEFAMSYFCMGQAYEASGQYRSAIDNFETAMQKKGIVRDAAVMLKAEIECYYKLNLPDQAMAEILEGMRRFPDDSEFEIMRIHHEMTHGQSETAVSDLQLMIQGNPNVADLYLDLAKAHMQISSAKLALGDLQTAGLEAVAARDTAKDAIKRFPDDARFYEELADVLRFGGDFPDAEKTLLELDARPKWHNQPEPQDKLGMLYSAWSNPEKAKAAYLEALRRARENEKPPIEIRYASVLSKLGEYNAALAVLAPNGYEDHEVGRQRANVLVHAGRFAEAEAELKSLLVGDPPDAALLQAAWGDLELQQGRRDAANEHVGDALSSDPRSVPALILRSQLRMAQQPPDWQGALQDLDVARQVQPDDTDILSMLCDVYLYRLDADQATQVLQTALRDDPTNMPIRFRLAYVLSNYEPVRLDQALAVLQDGERQPGGERNPDLYNDLANVYEQQGNANEALKTIEDAIAKIPGNATLVRSYLQLLLRTKQYAAAKDGASEVVRNNPGLWWAWESRGQAEAVLGDKTTAMTDLTQALNEAEGAHDVAAASTIVAIIAHDVDSQVAVNLVRQRVGGDPQWEFTLILLYHQRGEDALAAKELDTFLAAAKDYQTSALRPRLALAGMIYADAQPKPYADKAYQVYKQMLALNPDDVDVLNNFACVCADDFDPPKIEEGMTAIRQAMSILNTRGVSNPFVEDTYGWLLILGGQTSDGMDVLRKAVTRSPFPDAYYHLGVGYLRMRRPQDAQEQVNLALAEVSRAETANKPVTKTLKNNIEDLSKKVLEAITSQNGANLP